MLDQQSMAAAFFILLGLLIASIELGRRGCRSGLDALTFFNFFYFLFFVIAPLHVLALGDDAVRQKFSYEQYGPGDEVTALVLIVCYLLFVIGYMLFPRAGVRSPESNDTAGIIPLTVARRSAIAMFIVGVLAMMFHVVQVGGIREAVLLAPFVRAGEFEFETRLLFIRNLVPFLSTALMVYLAYYLGTKLRGRRIEIRDRIWLAIFVAGYLYYALASAGRRELVYPVLLYFLVSTSAGRSFGARNTLLVTVALVVGITAASASLSGFLGAGEFSDFREDLLRVAYFGTVQGLADSYVHFVGMQHAELWQFGFLKDLVELPLQFLPSGLLEFERGRGLLGETSEFFLGEALPENRTGEEPPGLHGYLLVNFGYAGMFLLLVFVGVAFRYLHNVLRPVRREDTIAWLIYWLVFLGFLVIFRDGVIVFALKLHATWWVAIAVLLAARKSLPGSTDGVPAH